jgi:hypothetical protein
MQARPPTFDARGDTPGPSDDDGRSRGQTTLDFAVGMSLFLISVAFVISFTPNLIQPFADSGTEDTIIANRVASQLVEGTLADPGKPYVLDKACTVAFFAPEHADGEVDGDDLNDTNDDLLEPSSRGTDGDGDPYPARHSLLGDPLWTNNQDDCNFELDYLHKRVGVAGIGDDGSVDESLSPGLQIEIRGDARGDGDEDEGILCYEAPGGGDADPPLGEDREIIDSDGSPWNRGDACDASGGDYDIPFQVGEDPPEDSGSVVVARRIVTIDGVRATVHVRVW